MENVRLGMKMVLRRYIDVEQYNDLWEGAKKLSYAGSTFPYPDAGVVATYSMVLQLNMKIQKLERMIDSREC